MEKSNWYNQGSLRMDESSSYYIPIRNSISFCCCLEEYIYLYDSSI